MSKVVDHLAELTGFRDRDLLDTTLVSALSELLQPRSAAIYRCVGDVADLRWLTRARVDELQTTPVGDPLWAELDELPRLAAFPHRAQALRLSAPLHVPGPSPVTLFALGDEHEAMGVLELHSHTPLDDGALKLVGSILRIYRNFQSLLDYSERDTLTGLLNRKTFDEAFYKLQTVAPVVPPPAERRSALQRAQSHFLAVIDIDHFKAVNDNWGHLIGDEVLLLLSRLMRSSFRFQDRLYRFGGEEFVVLLRCADDGHAAAAVERFREVVQAFAFPQVGRITVSIGYTELQPGDTPGGAFERADKAVYWSKAHGRNQVTSHRALLSAGALADDTHVGGIELF